MSSRDLARKVSHWTKSYGFVEEVRVGRSTDHYSVEFEARTTKTRASTMVTRLQLMSNALGPGAIASKELIGEPPANRAALSTWRITVSVSIQRRLEAA